MITLFFPSLPIVWQMSILAAVTGDAVRDISRATVAFRCGESACAGRNFEQAATAVLGVTECEALIFDEALLKFFVSLD